MIDGATISGRYPNMPNCAPGFGSFLKKRFYPLADLDSMPSDQSARDASDGPARGQEIASSVTDADFDDPNATSVIVGDGAEVYEEEGSSMSTKFAIFLISFGIFLASWQIVASATGNSLIISNPLTVFRALVQLLANNVPSAAEGIQQPSAAIALTLEVILIGFGFGAVVGIPVGILAGRWSLAESIIDPWVIATYSIPIVALLPTLYYALGGSFFADVFITFLLSVFTIIVNTQNGVKYMSRSLADVGRILPSI